MFADTGYLYDLFREVGLSDFQSRTIEFIIVRPLKILLIILLAMLVARISARWVRRSVRGLQLRTPLLASSPRAEQRAQTIGDVLASLVRIVIWFVTVLVVFNELGVDLGPLLAGAGIAGIAIGFGAQSLVKDYISGLFILIEDQYGVGDLVELGTTTGTVEEVNLRVTRLRSMDGKVWFVPNGEIRQVGNASLEWARAVVDVLVSHDADLDRVIPAITDEINRMDNEPEWADVILESPEVWGVEKLAAEGITIRFVVKTQPQMQLKVGRELRGRVSHRLQREGIAAPGRTVLVSAPPPAAAS